MQTRKVPLRKCVVTNERLPKKELIRVVRTPEGNVIVDDDKNGKTNGRGAYLKKALEVIEQAQKSKVLERHLETKIDDELYKSLVKVIQK